jgi:serine/threonine protein kinase
LGIAGEYELGRALGAGSIGRVYEAVHRPTGRRVAVKLTGSWVARDARLRRALLDEATAAARLRHPNVVALLDVGRDSEHAPFLVMEYVEGHDLVAWIDRWPGWDAVFEALRDTLLALSAAHAAGIVHGDVKPENLLRRHDGVVKLTDFGVARVRDPLRASDPSRAVAGTPWYMAPEQLAGAALGPATDLYAFGVVLYELLAGALPWPDTDDLRSLREAKNAPVRPLLPRAGLGLPADMPSYVGRLLAHDPRRRFRFAAEALAELEALAAFVDDRVPDRRDTVAASPDAPRASAISIRSPSRPPSLPAETESNIAGWLARLRAPGLFGRDDETDLVAEHIRSVVHDRAPRLLLLVGPAGIGKSRIAAWGFEEVEARGLMDRAAAGFDLDGHDPARGLRPAIAELVGRPSDARGRTPPEWRWLADDGELPFDAGAMEGFVRGEPTARERAIALSLAALDAVAAHRPIYLWLDDLGWSDDGSLDVVEQIVTRGHAPILVVATLRSGTVDHPRVRARIERLKGAPGTTTLEVAPLGFTARKSLLQSILPLAPGVAETLARTAGDTPLVLVQFLLGLVANGSLVAGPDGWRPRDGVDIGWIAIQTAQATVLADRLDRLLRQFGARAEDAESILIRAALVGGRFAGDALRHTTDAPSLSELVDEVLDRGLLDGLLRARDGAYDFEHGLYREGLLERLAGRADRIAILREVGTAMVHVSDHRYSEITLRIATMLRDAGELGAAMRVLRTAIGYSVEMSDMGQAAELLALGDRWIDSEPSPELEARLWHLGAHAGFHYFRSEYDAARRALGEVIERADPRRHGVHAARAHALHAAIAFYTGDMHECERRLETASGIAVDDEEVAFVEFFIADLYAKLAEMRRDEEASLRWREQGFELSKRLGARRGVNASLELMSVHVTRGEHEIARRYAANARELAESRRDRNLLAKAAIGETWIDLTAGDLAGARARLATFRHLFREHPWRRTEVLLIAAIVVTSDSPMRTRAATRRFLRAYARAPTTRPSRSGAWRISRAACGSAGSTQTRSRWSCCWPRRRLARR